MVSKKIVLKWLKFVFVASTCSFLIIQIQLRRGANNAADIDQLQKSIDYKNQNSNGVAPAESEIKMAKIDKIGKLEKIDKMANVEKVENDHMGTENQYRSTFGMPGLDEIRQSIDDNNDHAQILNEAKYGPVESVDYVILVQVHNRSKYLEQLIHSLSKSRGIDRALLIFSHDYYSTTFNQLVRSVTFCRTMQIFYPYSLQIFPDRFPGQDPRDCPADITKETAERRKCQNWRTPDKYGHYRVATLSQVKHHWWWKMNYVFDGITRLRNYSGYVIRLEEDHYVSPDFLHTFDYIVKNKESLCSECSVITLGFYLKSYTAYSSTMNKLAVYPWFSSRHNMGMAINRNTWEQIRACSNLFCTYDDYNWDWSLMRVNLKCLKPSMTVIYAKSPRVFHIGDCGIHHTGKQCTADSSATKVVQILESAKKELFPEKLEVSERSRRSLKAPKENGGWGDTRDHDLCLNHSQIHLQKNLQERR